MYNFKSCFPASFSVRSGVPLLLGRYVIGFIESIIEFIRENITGIRNY